MTLAMIMNLEKGDLLFLLRQLENAGENISWNIVIIFRILNKIVNFFNRNMMAYSIMQASYQNKVFHSHGANTCYRHHRNFQNCQATMRYTAFIGSTFKFFKFLSCTQHLKVELKRFSEPSQTSKVELFRKELTAKSR